MYAGVSRGTVRRALLELELEEYIRRRQGKGTFVNRIPVEYRLGETSSFSHQVRRAGRRPGSRMLESGLMKAGEAGKEVMEALRLSSADPVIRIKRLRLGDDVPLAVQTVYLLPERCPGILEENYTSLYEFLRKKYGIRITEADEVLRAATPSKEDKKLLGLRRAQVIIRRRTAFDQDGRPVEVMNSVEAADWFKYRYRIVEDATDIVLKCNRIG